jgi:putative ABC transport system ATP-binding protein
MSIDINSVIEVQGLTKTFGSGETRVEVLRGIDLSVSRGQMIAIMGPSGSGKSTLLHLIGALDSPTGGTVRVGSEDLSRLNDDQLTRVRRREVGFVFQSFNLLDVLSGAENVALPLLIEDIGEPEATRRAVEELRRVGMSHRVNHIPAQLSGGEQQRIAIARALVTRPTILLADEPTGNLDSVTGEQIMNLLRALVDERGQTILLVTHNAQHAAFADRLVSLRDGQIIEDRRQSRDSAGAPVPIDRQPEIPAP